jgi:hypothetical protein
MCDVCYLDFKIIITVYNFRKDGGSLSKCIGILAHLYIEEKMSNM